MITAIAAVALSGQTTVPKPITLKLAFLTDQDELPWKGLPGKREVFENPKPLTPIHATIFTGSIREFGSFMGAGEDFSSGSVRIVSRPIVRTLMGMPGMVSQGTQFHGMSWQSIVDQNPKDKNKLDVTLSYAPSMRDPKSEEPWPFTHKFSLLPSQTLALGFLPHEKDRGNQSVQAVLFEVVLENAR